MKKIFIFLLLPLYIFPIDIVKIKNGDGDRSFDYFYDLLVEVMEDTKDEFGEYQIEVDKTYKTQGRILEEIKSENGIDLYWVGTNIEREKELEPIRIPLFMGLLGYRVPVIRREDYAYFEEIYDIKDLKVLKGIQGSHWPDYNILVENQLDIISITDIEDMYQMLKYKRVDYFPREISSVYKEVERYGEDELVVFDKLIIKYSFPMYFFLNKKNERLINRLNIGLKKMVEEGKILEFMKNHPLTKDLFPLDRYKDSMILELVNSTLPTDTPLENEKLWIEMNNKKTD